MRGETEGSQDTTNGYDPLKDYVPMKANTDAFSALFHSLKPTIARVHGTAAAGGSDIALCCDLVIMADDARIGYPPSRAWGCPTTAMWATRIGVEKAKFLLFTGDLISGREAAAAGLILRSVPGEELEAAVSALCKRIATVPANQLFMQKQLINSSIEQNISSSQRLGIVFDGLSRNSPEGVAFQRFATREGFRTAVRNRDAGADDPSYTKWWRSRL